MGPKRPPRQPCQALLISTETLPLPEIAGPQADLNLGIQVSVDGGATTTPDHISIDTSTSSTQTISYFATDQNGLTGYATRTVLIQPAASATTP